MSGLLGGGLEGRGLRPRSRRAGRGLRRGVSGNAGPRGRGCSAALLLGTGAARLRPLEGARSLRLRSLCLGGPASRPAGLERPRAGRALGGRVRPGPRAAARGPPVAFRDRRRRALRPGGARLRPSRAVGARGRGPAPSGAGLLGIRSRGRRGAASLIAAGLLFLAATTAAPTQTTFARDIEIREPSRGRVVAVLSNVRIGSRVAGDVVAWGGSVTFLPSGFVEGNL